MVGDVLDYLKRDRRARARELEDDNSDRPVYPSYPHGDEPPIIDPPHPPFSPTPVEKVNIEVNPSSRFERFILALQISWRPIMAFQTIAEFIAMDIMALHELWTGDLDTVNVLLQFQSFLKWYFGFKLSLLGIYSIGRSAEKVTGKKESP